MNFYSQPSFSSGTSEPSTSYYTSYVESEGGLSFVRSEPNVNEQDSPGARDTSLRSLAWEPQETAPGGGLNNCHDILVDSLDDLAVEPASLEENQEDMVSASHPAQAGNTGACSVCHLPYSVTRAGAIRTHGPVHNRCQGSGKPPSVIPPCVPRDNAIAVTCTPYTSTNQPPPSDTVTLSPVASSRILKRVPRGSRDHAAKKMASIVQNVVIGNDPLTWQRLLLFAPRCLRVPRRGGKRWKLTSAVNQQIREEMPDVGPQTIRQHGRQARNGRAGTDSFDILASKVAGKLEEGDYRGAVRLACGSDSVAEHSPETLEILNSKHPRPHPDSSIMPAPDADLFASSITEEDVRRAIMSFPNGSAGGPDGLRPQHLKDLIGPAAIVGGPLLLSALTSLVNLMLRGETPVPIRPFLFGAKLVALRKKQGGIRPIAVGCTLRRLAAKCASSIALRGLPDLLAPHQVGCGVPLGIDAAVHATRRYLQSLQSDQAIIKVDFTNAFNTIRRDRMLLAVEEFIPELLPFIHSVYCESSSLMWGTDIIQSSERIQQGDPLGPLLFCLSIHKMCTKLQSELAVFYLDDGTLGGHWTDVVNDLTLIEEESSALGLLLNKHKTELICPDNNTRRLILSAFPEIQVVNIEEAELLGAPLGNATSVDACLDEKIKSLELMGERLSHLHAHDALSLLRHSFAIPKLMHVLRTSPCFDSSRLQKYDELLRTILSHITNIRFEETDPSWLQATLPVNRGGLGIRSAVHLAPSAFLASADGSSQLVNEILPSRFQAIPDQEHLKALTQWDVGPDVTPPAPPKSFRMKAWDAPRVEDRAEFLLSSTNDAKSRARLLSVSARESGAWLQALPVSSLGLRLDDEAVRIAVGLRLGCPLSAPHTCVHCGEDVDQYATHCLSCKWSQGRHS